MRHVAISSSGIRTGRRSHKVALYFQRYITDNQLATVELIDLKEANLPLSEERLSFLSDPAPEITSFAEKIKKADAVLVVSPEYNHSIPAGLKNAIDLLYEEWYRKPVALATVSSGMFGGVNALTLLQVIFIRVKAIPTAEVFPVPKVKDAFDAEGNPSDKESTDKRAARFVNDLLWFAEAVAKMKS